ncbi:osmoprotectant transport system substrate-binding protein [Kitasatospora sp. MAP12-15]|uniref:ABC transporter substrate-binding protein n=1 Tax=unclassified Kitasatospora TaxID=2633591 RepID=UPI0024761ADD|nr:ABC transporter substrate-binding protein [Kitasatospora sp. MAP12-44]MDH6113992.1 osmoprotectant transport system substrate-binding protein [Kitasatospora sp. MAP12-44]
MSSRSRATTSLVLMAAIALAATACSSSKSDPLGGGASQATGSGSTVTIGSANYPENVLLASIYSQALQAKGIKVDEKFNIGSREVIYGQLQSGNLTILPEYNGGLLQYLDAKSTASTAADVDAALLKDLPSSLELLNPSTAEDKDSLTVSQATAAKYNLKSIPDLAAQAANFTIGGEPEFKSRREQQFKDVYGLTFKDWKPTADTTANALKDGSLQVGDVFTTDPRISSLGLVTLTDPKDLFGAQNVTPLVYKAGVNQTVTDTLNAVSAKLDTPGLLALMKKVSIDKDDPSAVAKDWVKASGLS